MAWLSQTVLEAIAAVGGVATTAEIAEPFNLQRRAVSKCCQVLRRRSLITCAGVGRYELTDGGRQFLAAKGKLRSGPRGPLSGPRKSNGDGLRDRLWTALRSLGKASIPDLLQLAARGNERAATNNAHQFMRALEVAGIVVVMARREAGTAVTSNGFKRYALLRDIGPKTPRLKKHRSALFDPNSGKSYPLRSEA